MALPTNGDELYETVIEPLMTPLNAGRVDSRALRARLPAANAKKRTAGRLAVDDAVIHTGSLAIGKGVELAISSYSPTSNAPTCSRRSRTRSCAATRSGSRVS